MTIIENRYEARPVFEGRTRSGAAWFLVLGPAFLILGTIPATAAGWLSPGLDDAGLAVAQPQLTSIGVIVDWLTVPAQLGLCWALLMITRPWSPRVAWTGFIALGLQACALASVVGMELLASVLVEDGASMAAVNGAMDSGLIADPAGIFLFAMFMGAEIVGLIAFGIALWRTRWAPKWVAIVYLVLPFADFLLNGVSKLLAGLLFTLVLAGSVVLARGVIRNGAPRPSLKEQTDRA